MAIAYAAVWFCFLSIFFNLISLGRGDPGTAGAHAAATRRARSSAPDRRRFSSRRSLADLELFRRIG